MKFSNLRIVNDELGELISNAINDYLLAESWEVFVANQQVDPPDLAATVGTINHLAWHLLKHLRVHGAPIPMTTTPWSGQQLDAAISQGAHNLS